MPRFLLSGEFDAELQRRVIRSAESNIVVKLRPGRFRPDAELQTGSSGKQKHRLALVDENPKTAASTFRNSKLNGQYQPSPQARPRQALARNQHLSAQRSQYRTAIKRVRKFILAGDKAAAQEAFKNAQSVIDSMCRKGVLHTNAAARHKSRLSAAIKALA